MYDMISCLLLFTIIKSSAASTFYSDIDFFEKYVKRRVCSIVVEVLVLSVAAFLLFNYGAWKSRMSHTLIAINMGAVAFLFVLIIGLDVYF